MSFEAGIDWTCAVCRKPIEADLEGVRSAQTWAGPGSGLERTVDAVGHVHYRQVGPRIVAHATCAASVPNGPVLP